jgi:predicted DNA-binding transcriptional regulator AlpA
MSNNPTLRLHDAPAQAAANSSPMSAIEPLLIGAEVAGRLCGVSEATWWRMHAAARVPSPVKVGRKTLWRITELREWVAASCPGRQVWDALRKQNGAGR